MWQWKTHKTWWLLYIPLSAQIGIKDMGNIPLKMVKGPTFIQEEVSSINKGI
jgi:hypothetical protein